MISVSGLMFQVQHGLLHNLHNCHPKKLYNLSERLFFISLTTDGALCVLYQTVYYIPHVM